MFSTSYHTWEDGDPRDYSMIKSSKIRASFFTLCPSRTVWSYVIMLRHLVSRVHSIGPLKFVSRFPESCASSFLEASSSSSVPAMSDSDDDVPALSAHALAALQDFYNQALTSNADGATPGGQFAVGAVEEDWGMSQFWYSEETATRLAEEAVREAGEGGRIACVSAPSVYQKLKQGVVDGSDGVSAVVLEYDKRFATYGEEFIFYDYNEPLSLPSAAAPQSFDIVLADPPYLSEECLSKVAQTVKYLSKGKVLLCTGAIMENIAKEVLDVKMCSFLPKHNRNLSNDFRCFVNYPSHLLC